MHPSVHSHTSKSGFLAYCLLMLTWIFGEFLRYQVEQFPKELTPQRIDAAWHLQMTDANGVKTFSMLASVATRILIIFHSNADCERTFNIVRKNKTEFQPTLSTRVLNALLSQKISMSPYGQMCYKLQYSKDILRKTKQAIASKQLARYMFSFFVCCMNCC